MFDLQGAEARCRVFGDYPDEEELRQIYALLNSPAHRDCGIRIMPDHHAGKGCVIGFTATLDLADPKVIPSLVGVDGGCGVEAINLGKHTVSNESLSAFDALVRARMPSGFHLRDQVYPELPRLFKKVLKSSWPEFEASVNALAQKVGADTGKVWQAVGTLGQGNHFLEVDLDGDGFLWLVVHTGSRNFGLRVSEFYQRKAVTLGGPKGGLEWLHGLAALEYFQGIRIVQTYATLNRAVILSELAPFFAVDPFGVERVASVHNYIGDDNIIRKGAISAKAGERVIIPWNMEAGLVIGTGKGNADWNQSAPHGAGRKMGRGVAKRTLSLDEFETRMKAAGVWSSCVGKDTLDEAPMAYRDPNAVETALADTVQIVSRLRPVYNFKAA